ncbi:Csu type fimbrial protein [Roseateles amylovorans]|uniref:Spore coat U domain-containing protein n=1 Tax=Roseateles amylovorans TaxID=2978473 RepID=A0ABY6B1W6_9BURK|nr:spore coat U domain-containing protein [Roseateles amylovorans]UXH79395.1 spore coat U domain-containing protein [Roseateles amylovorans]
MNTFSTRTGKTIQRIAVGLALMATAAATSVTATASTVGTTFQVTATIVSACTVSGSTLNFGSAIDPLATATPLDGTSTLTVTCSNTTPYAVALNAGANAGGASNFSARTMTNGANTLAYQLYLDSGRSTVWGDGTASSSTKAGTGSGSAQTLSVYGRIPSLANVVPGAYTDTVTVTITY